MLTLSSEKEERAGRLHSSAVVIDSLGYPGPLIFTDKVIGRVDELVAQDIPGTAIWAEVERLQDSALLAGELDEYWTGWDESGVDVSSWTLGVFGPPPFTYDNAVRDVAAFTRKFDAFDQLIKVTKADDILRIHDEGKHGFILNFQNTTHFGDDLSKLEFFYSLGIRIIQLTYNSRNFVGDGCTERNPAGLSLFGIEAVKRMNELGILIDVSHCSAPTSLDAVKHSDVPIAITHSFAKSISDHDRGKTDEVIAAVGERGYVGICLVPFFITGDPNVTLDHWLAHVEHIVKLVGPEHVGIGTDWGGNHPKPLAEQLNKEMGSLGFREEHRLDWSAIVEEFESWEKWPNLTRALVSAGYSDEEITGFVGGNFLRVFKAAVG